MKKAFCNRLLLICILCAAAGSPLFANGSRQGGGSQSQARPATWIADRKIVIQAYVDDIGDYLPDNQAANPAFQELKKRTGIDLEVRYTPGEKDRFVMAAQLAAGAIPDMILCYLNNSTRPEFPILLKAAKDGMFADLSSYFAGAKAYNRYLEPGYLPNDTRRNIMWRDDFNGQVYLVHLAIPATDDYLKFDPNADMVGGPYINEKIAQSLNLDVTAIKTADDFYNLLVRIKNGNFRDNNGRPVTPLGPKFWGGSVDAIEECMPGLFWGVSDGYNITAEGKILHEIETDWAWRRVQYMRRLLSEGLMDKEFFTMDTTRALEYYTGNSGAIMGDVHNYVPLIRDQGGWIPIPYMTDWNGNNRRVTNGKGAYGAWAVSADAKNPREIFAFMDYMSTQEGQLFATYGLEGLTFNLVNGKPRVTADVAAVLSDDRALSNRFGFGFGGAGNYFFEYILTNKDNKGLFGEIRPGASGSAQFANSIAIASKYPLQPRLVEGLAATAYLNADEMADIKAKMDLLNYKETLSQAVFAAQDAEARRILDNFKAQLTAAGLKQFETYLEALYKKDPKSINFR
ncbi:MAG: extracellular solute-binding protein [Treponema sp.]|nr:extracellular solute-binding protein [Treponema sp.]